MFTLEGYQANEAVFVSHLSSFGVLPYSTSTLQYSAVKLLILSIFFSQTLSIDRTSLGRDGHPNNDISTLRTAFDDKVGIASLLHFKYVF